MAFIIPIITWLLLGEKISDISFMFILPMLLCILGGGFLYYYFHTEEDIRNREAFVLVPTVWIFMVIVGAFPYIVSERLGLMSYEMGVFEVPQGPSGAPRSQSPEAPGPPRAPRSGSSGSGGPGSLRVTLPPPRPSWELPDPAYSYLSELPEGKASLSGSAAVAKPQKIIVSP